MTNSVTKNWGLQKTALKAIFNDDQLVLNHKLEHIKNNMGIHEFGKHFEQEQLVCVFVGLSQFQKWQFNTGSNDANVNIPMSFCSFRTLLIRKRNDSVWTRWVSNERAKRRNLIIQSMFLKSIPSSSIRTPFYTFDDI